MASATPRSPKVKKMPETFDRAIVVSAEESVLKRFMAVNIKALGNHMLHVMSPNFDRMQTLSLVKDLLPTTEASEGQFYVMCLIQVGVKPEQVTSIKQKMQHHYWDTKLLHRQTHRVQPSDNSIITQMIQLWPHKVNPVENERSCRLQLVGNVEEQLQAVSQEITESLTGSEESLSQGQPHSSQLNVAGQEANGEMRAYSGYSGDRLQDKEARMQQRRNRDKLNSLSVMDHLHRNWEGQQEIKASIQELKEIMSALKAEFDCQAALIQEVIGAGMAPRPGALRESFFPRPFGPTQTQLASAAMPTPATALMASSVMFPFKTLEDANRFFSGMVVPLDAAYSMADEHFKNLATDPSARESNRAALRVLETFFSLEAIGNCVWEWSSRGEAFGRTPIPYSFRAWFFRFRDQYLPAATYPWFYERKFFHSIRNILQRIRRKKH